MRIPTNVCLIYPNDSEMFRILLRRAYNRAIWRGNFIDNKDVCEYPDTTRIAI